MTLAGHSFAHFPQPTHLPSITSAMIPRTIAIACMGHTLTQHPQATQAVWSTTAFRRFLTRSIRRLLEFAVVMILQYGRIYRDVITERAGN